MKIKLVLINLIKELNMMMKTLVLLIAIVLISTTFAHRQASAGASASASNGDASTSANAQAATKSEKKSRKNWDNDSQYQGYEWREAYSHEENLEVDDPSLFDVEYRPIVEDRIRAERFRDGREYIEEDIEEIGIEERIKMADWYTNAEKKEFKSDPDVNRQKPKPQKKNWGHPTRHAHREAPKPRHNRHRADTSGAVSITSGNWNGAGL